MVSNKTAITRAIALAVTIVMQYINNISAATTNNDNQTKSVLWRTIFSNNFEESLEPFIEPNNATSDWKDAHYYKGGGMYVHGNGTKSMRIQDGDEQTDSSYFYTDYINVSSYDFLRINFWYYGRSMEPGESFFLETSEKFTMQEDDDHDDSSGNTIIETMTTTSRRRREWISGSHFVNDVWTNEAIEFDSTNISEISIKFQCNANRNGDKVYLDDVTFLGGMTTINSDDDDNNNNNNEPPSLLPTTRTLFPTSSPTVLPTSHTTELPTYHYSSTSTLPTEYPIVNTHIPSLKPFVSPSVVPSEAPTSSLSATTNNRDDLCPIDRSWKIPSKYCIESYEGDYTGGDVDDDLSEISYIAFSSQTDTYGNKFAYVASDKEQQSLKVVKFSTEEDQEGNANSAGTVVAVYDFTNINTTNADWEDISLGPCDDGTNSDTCIYIGNFGNNARDGYVQRQQVEVFKFKEDPNVAINPSNRTIEVGVLDVSYGLDQQLCDAESIFVDWQGSSAIPGDNKGDIYIITKGCDSSLYKVPVSQHSHIMNTSNPIITTAFVTMSSLGTVTPAKTWTGADMSRDGNLIALRTTNDVYFYPRLFQSQSIEDALSVYGPCSYIAPTPRMLVNERKYEGVAFVDNNSIAETSECDNGISCKVPVYFYDLINVKTDISSINANIYHDWVIITEDDFESGWGNYESGGTFANRITATTAWACQGTSAIEIADNNGISSSFYHSSSQDCTYFSMLNVTFQFKWRSSEGLDDFFLEISLDDGKSWMIVDDWTRGVKSYNENRNCYSDSVILEAVDFGRTNFGSQVKLRFRSNADAANDRAYIDGIRFQGRR